MHKEQDNSQQKDEKIFGQNINVNKKPASRASDNTEKTRRVLLEQDMEEL